MASLTVNVKAKLDVDQKSAEACLRLLELFVNANPVDIVCTRNKEGEVELQFVERRYSPDVKIY